MKKEYNDGTLITDKDGDFVACLAYVPEAEEIAEIIAAYNDLTGNEDAEEDFHFDTITVVVKSN